MCYELGTGVFVWYLIYCWEKNKNTRSFYY